MLSRMKKIVVFGGTGGVGQKLIPFLEQKYQVTALGSKNVDVTSFEELKNFFTTPFSCICSLLSISFTSWVEPS
jgi:dTDP-4-dehydrorhamnose reductase